MKWYSVFSKIYEAAARRMCQDCEEFIKKNSKMLDLGCGSAIVSTVFRDFFRIEIIGVDVSDRRIFPIPFKKIDGKSLPFTDNSFDSVLIAYVLHHAKDPVSLLKEAKRVTKDKILIYEDLPANFISSFFCNLHGFSFDKFFSNKNRTSFKKEEEWRRIFENLGLEIVFQKKVSWVFDPVEKKLFVLKKHRST